MKPIADIRLYRCERYDALTPPATLPIADKPLSAAVKRIVMKLRERRFSLGEFDHLYCIFTAAPLPSEFSSPIGPTVSTSGTGIALSGSGRSFTAGSAVPRRAAKRSG